MEITKNEKGGFSIEGITQEDLNDLIGVLSYGYTTGSSALLNQFEDCFGVGSLDDLLDNYYPAITFAEPVGLADGTEGLTICPTIKKLENK